MEVGEILFPGLDVVTESRTAISLFKLKMIAISSENSLESRVRATVLYILGSVFVPTASNVTVKAFYGAFLQDIYKIKRYAWGELMLSEIHAALTNIKKQKISSSIDGSMHILIVSCYNFVYTSC